MKPTPAIVQTVEAEAPLADLARRIAGAHADTLAAARCSVEHARRCGELLLRAKARLPHGRFAKWVEANCPFSSRTGQNYMRVARDWEEIQAAVEGEEADTIAGALQALAGPADPKAQPTAVLAETICGPDLPPEVRRERCARWYDEFAGYILVMDARGRSPEEIAEDAGQPLTRVQGLLSPTPPDRSLAMHHLEMPADAAAAYPHLVRWSVHGHLSAHHEKAACTAYLMGWAAERGLLVHGQRRHGREAARHWGVAGPGSALAREDMALWLTLYLAASEDAAAALGQCEPENPLLLLGRVGGVVLDDLPAHLEALASGVGAVGGLPPPANPEETRP
jgi:hypothetical protein